jgi:predicted dehydrogenase
VALATETGTFLMEGVWMRFNPLVRELQELVAGGGLGEIRSLRACFGFPAAYDAAGRLWDPALGGGALLDLGVYAVDLARLLLGTPSGLLARGSLAPTGADAEAGLLLSWPSGAHATLAVSLLAQLPGTATVVGSAGWAEIGPSFHAPMQLVVHRAGEQPETRTIDDRQAGFTGELEEVEHCLAAGSAQSRVMPLTETVGTMQLLQQARALLAEQ